MIDRVPILLAVWVTLVGVALPTGAPAQEAHSFYVGLLRDGIRAYERGDPLTAAEDLRIACFGLLGSPRLLARGLSHLALAQAALENQAGFELSFRRLTELEERFQAFTASELDEGVRQDLETAARRWISEAEADSSILFRRPAPPEPRERDGDETH